MTRIFLVGMPGAGKSTLGKQLAAAMDLPFADLDMEIEKKVGKTVSEIFTEKGEAWFRELEAQLLKKWASSGTGFVLATGGGAPCFHEGMSIINRSGVSIFVDVPINELLRRTKGTRHRPLLSGAGKAGALKRLLEERYNTYSTAHIKIGKDHSASEVVSMIGQLTTKTSPRT